MDEALGSSEGHLSQPAATQETTSLSTGYHSMGASGRNYPLPCVALYDFAVSVAISQAKEIICLGPSGFEVVGEKLFHEIDSL